MLHVVDFVIIVKVRIMEQHVNTPLFRVLTTRLSSRLFAQYSAQAIMLKKEPTVLHVQRLVHGQQLLGLTVEGSTTLLLRLFVLSFRVPC